MRAPKKELRRHLATHEPSEPHSDPHCYEHVKWRGLCGDIECYCSCHEPKDSES